jgi:hypothetical protein
LSISKRLRRAAVGVAAVAVLGTVASSALAGANYDPTNDPNTTNVPYLAWRGENLRLVQCFGASDFTRIRKQENPGLSANVADVTDDQMSNIFGSIVQTNVAMIDWSGYDTGSNQPHEVINGARTFLWFNFTTHHPVICFQDTWDSAKAGLASFKLTVSAGLTNIDNTGVSIGSQVLVLQHQWLAGWMSLNLPEINEVPSINQTGTNQNPEGLGDANGGGKFFAGNHWYQNSSGVWTYDPSTYGVHPGEIRATVKGTLPLGQDFTELGIGDANNNITLPDDWAKLAGALATDGNYLNSNPAMRWDIHDEMVDQFGNTQTIPAATAGGRNGVGTTWKNVENVAADSSGTNNPLNMNNGDAWFTRNGVTTSLGTTILPPSTGPTSGPFDPNYAGESLLPDGALNSGDAPMPAARIDFSIAANTDPLASADGVGYFDSAWKAHDYSKDYTGSNAVAGNLFAPFYSQYIPATSRDDIGYASGVDGALITSNFPGFLVNGLYRNWTAIPLGETEPATTACNRADFQYRQTPSGAQTSAVYTDEHGEARISYYPGSGFYFDSLNTIPGDGDNGCDLQAQLVPQLGTSNISVTARYPYQKITDPDKVAKTTIKKIVLNLFDKHLSYYPKNGNYSSQNALMAKFVVAHAQDVDGTPFAGEKVCFKAQYHPSGAVDDGGMLPINNPNTGLVTILKPGGGTITVHQNGPAEKDRSLGTAWLCTTTDQYGNAVYEASGSVDALEDVLAYFADEGIYRHIDIVKGGGTFEDNPAFTPEMALAAPGAPTTGPGTNGTQAPTVETIKAFGGMITPVVTPAATVGVTPVATITQTITPANKIIVKKTTMRMLSLRLVRPAHGKAYIMVKVLSQNKTAKVTLTLKTKSGKTISKITKTIAANKLVKIQSSAIKLSVKKIGLTFSK